MVVGGLLEGRDGAACGRLSLAWECVLDWHARPHRRGAARGRRPQLDARPLHAGRLRRCARPAGDVLPVGDSHGPPRGAGRGHVPHRQQEPHRGCGSGRAGRVSHRPHRRARFLLGVAPCRIGSAGVSRGRREPRSDSNERLYEPDARTSRAGPSQFPEGARRHASARGARRFRGAQRTRARRPDPCGICRCRQPGPIAPRQRRSGVCRGTSPLRHQPRTASRPPTRS